MPEYVQNTQVGGAYYGPVGMGRNVAVNAGATGDPAVDDVRAQLAELRRLLAAHAAEVHPRAARDVDDVEAEVAQPDPDADRIRDALARLAVRVTAVATLTEAVHRLGDLVRHVTG